MLDHTATLFNPLEDPPACLAQRLLYLTYPPQCGVPHSPHPCPTLAIVILVRTALLLGVRCPSLPTRLGLGSVGGKAQTRSMFGAGRLVLRAPPSTPAMGLRCVLHAINTQ